MGEPRHRIHDEKNRLALVAKVLGDRHRRLRREAPHHRALVAGRDDRDGAGAVCPEGVVEKFPHLSAALADKRDHDGVELGRARKHREQRRLADA